MKFLSLNSAHLKSINEFYNDYNKKIGTRITLDKVTLNNGDNIELVAEKEKGLDGVSIRLFWGKSSQEGYY